MADKPTYEELKRRVKELEEGVKRKWSERELKQSAVLDAINRTFRETLTCETDEEVARTCLSIAEELTDSKFGFIGEVNQAGRFDTIALSNPGWDACKMPKSDAVVLIKDMEIRGIWSGVIKNQQPLIVNDPASHPDSVGTPEGHPNLTSFLDVPLKHAGRTVGMIALANKGSGYTVSDKENAEALGIAFVEALNRKRLQEAMRESEEKYRTLFEDSKNAIYVNTKKGKFIQVNQSMLDLFGYTRDEMIGMNAIEIYAHPEDWSESLKQIGQKGTHKEYEIKFKKKDGTEMDCLLTATVRSSDDGSIIGYQGIIRDITERKQAEDALKKSHDELDQALSELKSTQAQMLQSEKMASVGQLAAGVAHEINNPAGFVSSNLKTLSNYQNDITKLIKQYRKLITDLKDITTKKNLPSSITEQVEQILAYETEVDVNFILDDVLDLIKESREGTERIKKIVLDLKDFAHPGEDKIQTTNINKGIELTLNVAWNELKYKATVTKEYGDLPQVQCYPQQLNQVFMNLLVNAAQAIEKQGKINIITRALDGQVEIAISDTGSGIPQKSLSKIFDPFFTTKEIGKGTGLGLNVAYNIIQKHRGTIDVESEVGKGTTFRIRIPVDK